MKKALKLFIVMIVSISPLRAAVYYVNSSGSDTNPGTMSSPWATIQKGASTAVAGDTVYVQAGTYTEKVTFEQSGSSSSMITYEGLGNVIVQGTAAVNLWNGVFNINSKSYLRIRNFSFKNSYWFGIYVESSDHIYIESDSTYNTGASGISVWNSNHVHAFNNVVQKACYQSLATGSQECITFANVTDFEIHHNEVFESGGSNNGGEGIDTKEGCQNGKVYNNTVHDLVRLGIYADCWDQTLQNIEIYNNRVYNCHEGIVLSSENGGTLTDVKVYNNLTYNNTDFGITISDYGTNGPRKNISIMNNTVYNNGFGDGNTAWGGGIIILSTNVSNITVFNNLVSANDAMQISDESGVSSVAVSYNLIFGYKGLSWTYEVKGSNVVEADPLFVNTNGADNISGTADDNMDVSAMSPAINQGTNTNAPDFDYNYYRRPAENITDIGAYEHNSIPLTVLSVFKEVLTDKQNISLKVYPNPFVDFISIEIVKPVDRIEISDTKGTLVYSYDHPEHGILRPRLSASGIYIIKSSQAGDVEIYKAVKY